MSAPTSADAALTPQEFASFDGQTQLYVRNTFIEVREPTPPAIIRSKTCPSIASDSYDECDSCECQLPLDAKQFFGADSCEFHSPLARSIKTFASVSWCDECALNEAEATRDAPSFYEVTTDRGSEKANTQVCVRKTFIEVVPFDPGSAPAVMRSKTCPDLTANSWDEDQDEGEVLLEFEPHAERQLNQITLRADAKPFHPEDVPSSLRREMITEMIMQQVLESLSSACECTPREYVAALDCLRVPYNTPAAALYGQDNSPCLSEVANRFAMVGNEDVVCCA
jgi:hypothetical protein